MIVSLLSKQPLQTLWQPSQRFLSSELSKPLKSWLLYPGSFVTKFFQLNPTAMPPLRIQLLHESLILTSTVEQSFFQCRYLYLREVQIYIENHLLMYAQSVMPKDTLQHYKQRFRGLGSQALGKMLFDQPGMQRSLFEIAKVLASQPAYNFALSDSVTSVPYVWGRRSLFTLAKPLLLLTEVFASQFLTVVQNYRQ